MSIDANDNKTAELAEMIRQIRERVRASYPEGTAEGIALADLMPVVHARDAAIGKAAAIGEVNPRPGGPLNTLVQSAKKLIARGLNWHVRGQVDFNRAALGCIEALLEAQNESNRALAELARRISALREPLERESQAMRDTTSYWNAWRGEWEAKLARVETQFLRSAAEAQSAYQHRASLMESNFRDLLSSHQEHAKDRIERHQHQIEEARATLARLDSAQRDAMARMDTAEAGVAEAKAIEQHISQIVEKQHADFRVSLEVASRDIQARLWKDLERVQLEYQSLIHHELRLIRQRASLSRSPEVAVTAPAEPGASNIDWLLFAQKFRGSEESIQRGFARYVPIFRNCGDVLDLGCGRGEFLTLLREASIAAKGIDASEECVALCAQKGLIAEREDIFRYLDALPDASVGGIFCSQVIEHLPPFRVSELVELCSRKLRPDAPVVFETPNPECLAIFATHFYLDPTHVRPVPPKLMAFYMEEAGLGLIEVTRIHPAIESLPSVEKLPIEFRHEFFDAMDYAISAKRLR